MSKELVWSVQSFTHLNTLTYLLTATDLLYQYQCVHSFAQLWSCCINTSPSTDGTVSCNNCWFGKFQCMSTSECKLQQIVDKKNQCNGYYTDIDTSSPKCHILHCTQLNGNNDKSLIDWKKVTPNHKNIRTSGKLEMPARCLRWLQRCCDEGQIHQCPAVTTTIITSCYKNIHRAVKVKQQIQTQGWGSLCQTFFFCCKLQQN